MFTILLALSSVPVQAAAEDGRAIYVAKCQSCHGAAGRGDGPAAMALPKKPRDMSQPAFWKEFSDDQVQSLITQGKPGSMMRGFPMADTQLTDLLSFLKSLRQTE